MSQQSANSVEQQCPIRKPLHYAYLFIIITVHTILHSGEHRIFFNSFDPKAKLARHAYRQQAMVAIPVAAFHISQGRPNTLYLAVTYGSYIIKYIFKPFGQYSI